MKNLFLIPLAILLGATLLSGQSKPLNIIAIGAHPDDCDSKFGGTAALFAKMGHNVKFLALTSGDAGHQSQGGGALCNRRRAEAAEAGRRLGIAEYETLDNHDGELIPTLQVRHQVIRAIREWDADIVLGLRSNDYHPDHRNTGKVVRQERNTCTFILVLFLLLSVGKILIMLWHNSGFSALIRRKITLSKYAIT